MEKLRIECISGASASRPVLMGFAPARELHRLSYADVLDEDTGRGYQRRFNAQHSLDFRRYIQRPRSSTIPLTFNLRPETADSWTVVRSDGGAAVIEIDAAATRVMTQVDCQHRLGHLDDLNVVLPFMAYVGLDAREEMEIFSVINGKAKGLSASLLDFHDGRLAGDLAGDRPELFIALHLNNEPASPWHRQLDLGGASTSGMTRRASLRTLQKAVKRFLSRSRILQTESVETVARTVLDYWTAIAAVLHEPWIKPRRYLLAKGIGVYALMDVAADLWLERRDGTPTDQRYFAQKLTDFATEIDWTSAGDLAGLGGESGAKAAAAHIRAVRRRLTVKAVANG
ncbi:DGQHR domain-containing protein [Sphingomonas sp.]|uniref:DGQHR domain-containing protein n=1 Tax=Sphingomonas sp. TaxID=28214 RepID=UPI002ED82E22